MTQCQILKLNAALRIYREQGKAKETFTMQRENEALLTRSDQLMMAGAPVPQERSCTCIRGHERKRTFTHAAQDAAAWVQNTPGLHGVEMLLRRHSIIEDSN